MHKVTQAFTMNDLAQREKVSLSNELGDTRSAHKLVPISIQSTLVILQPESAMKKDTVGEIKFVSDAELLGVKKSSEEKSTDDVRSSRSMSMISSFSNKTSQQAKTVPITDRLF